MNYIAILIIFISIIIISLFLFLYFFTNIFKKDKYTKNESDNEFEFKKQCDDKNGTLNLYKSSDITDPLSGNLLACAKKAEYGSPEVILASEIQSILNNIQTGIYNPKNEKERLQLYLTLVYPNAKDTWYSMNLQELKHYYTHLEFYYKLPAKIMPTTKIIIHRTKDKAFYKVPIGVILDQDPNRTGIISPYIEVTHFGSSYSFLRKPELFNGTYYYPATGSGLFLPVGNTLISYNKAHALKLLDVLNTDIVKIGGKDFQNFLRKDSIAAWNKIITTNPKAKMEDYWITTCVVDKHATEQDPKCQPYFGYYTKQISYIPSALDQIINEMVSGKSLRITKRKGKDGKIYEAKIYYGLSDSADKFLAQIAIHRNYDSLQFLREAEMSDGYKDPVVGSEFLHLMEPIYSQTFLARLNPFNTPYVNELNDYKRHNVNYLLDSTINPVSIKMLTNGNYQPWEDDDPTDDIDIIQPERNSNVYMKDTTPDNTRHR